jgi:hypothetical protein
MLILMLAWVLRFGLFAYKSWRWIMDDYYVFVVYGMAFDFLFQVHYLKTTTDFRIRSSAQGCL